MKKAIYNLPQLRIEPRSSNMSHERSTTEPLGLFCYAVQVCMYRILTEFKVFMYWKDPPRANRGAEPRSGEALRFVRAGLSSTWAPKNEVSIRLTQRRVKFSS